MCIDYFAENEIEASTKFSKWICVPTFVGKTMYIYCQKKKENNFLYSDTYEMTEKVVYLFG